ncbi:MAG: hypothetical protein EPO55_03220 [Reyranella sp.]|uniref:hypothetical protein n=1 Tax=Reyranella sp. TaxID=1929291 RepID=UPI0012091A4F|nr:hypothetical protein [Reyranella sp.]TAJ42054.1 MAG: hypothetical protein EPO55_03220 [Reyranella sp.]
MSDDLAEGNLFVELQVASWPPAVSQTLLRKRDGRQGLTIRAKASGRLRVELQREGYASLVVRTLHLRLRAPGLLRLTVAWRGDEAVVAAGGQIIGTSSDFAPEGFVSPEIVQETAAPVDHAGNERARTQRRQNAELLLQRLGADEAQGREWFAATALSGQVLADLVEMVREGRRHHLPGLAAELSHLLARGEPLLQWCAALVDAPLIIYAPTAPPAPDGTVGALIASAFDIASERGGRHELAVDLDVWLRHEQPWQGGRTVSIETLLVGISEALALPRADRPLSDEDRAIRAALSESGSTLEALCGFASAVSGLTRAVATAATPTQKS